MLKDGMTYHFIKELKEPLLNVIEQERNIFSNMLKVVCLWNPSLGKLDKRIGIYLQCNREENLNLREIQLGVNNVDLEGAYLSGADLRGADLRSVNLVGANLMETDLRGAYLRGADLERVDLRAADLSKANLRDANLCKTDLRGANLIETDLSTAILRETIFDEKQVSGLYEKYDLSGSRVYISKSEKFISYKEYSMRKQEKRI